MKFKVGDKVRVVATKNYPDLLGVVGTITELARGRYNSIRNEYWVGYGTDIRSPIGSRIYPRETSIELVVPVIRGLARLSQREKELA